MTNDPNQPPPDDDATRRSPFDQPASESGQEQQPGYGPQPGSQPGYGPQPGSQPGYGYGQQPPSSPGSGYGQQPESAPGYAYGQQPQPPSGYQAPPGQPSYGQPQYGPPQGGPHVPGMYGPRPGTDDTSMAMLSHLLGLLISWVGPLIIYLMKKDESPYVRDQAAEALNFQITMFIGYLVAGLLTIVLIGLLLLPVVWIVSLIFQVQAAIATNRGQNYRYPINIRLIT